MALNVPHPDFDALFVLYNHVRQRLDAALKKEKLTLTSLQVLALIARANMRRRQVLAADLVEPLGLTRSTLSVVIKQLTAKGWIEPKEHSQWPTRNRPLLLTAPGRRKLHAGLVAREDVLTYFSTLMSARDRSALLRAAGSVVAKIDESNRLARQEKIIKSFKHHETQVFLRGVFSEN